MKHSRLLTNAVKLFDVIVIGGGHAGCEAAAASARSRARTLLLTHRKETIGEMSCNPSFGGIGKGHLIREIDAMDGLCARICDKSAITYQALNTGQGPAILGLRAQIDRDLYKKYMQEEIICGTPNLTVIEGSVGDLIIENSTKPECIKVSGVILENGQMIRSNAVVVTTGTFLDGEVFWGLKRFPYGRLGEKACTKLSQKFSQLGFKIGRLRTGTPPRLLKKTIDFSKFELKPADKNPIPFSFLTKTLWIDPDKQLPTYLSYTNDRVAELVRKHYKEHKYIRSEQIGPRYCPSLESKIIKFENVYHKFFLEHEGLESELIYPQGMSMTFAEDVQREIMRSIPGLENVEIAQAGYGVEYDFINPQQLHSSLETKLVKRLFLAGQINGTTGYEEAAAQGNNFIASILAGINAAAVTRGIKPLLLDRTEAYIGVLVDDLTSLGTNEPYRMFTSRAEFRLHLRPDNADIRLTDKAYHMGVVSEDRYSHFLNLKTRLKDATELLKSIKYPLATWPKYLQNFKPKNKLGKVYTAYDLLHRHDISFRELERAFPKEMSPFLDNELESRIRIEGLYKKQHDLLVEKMITVRREGRALIPENIKYSNIDGLSFECMEKFEQWRPQNLAAASRVPGVTPEALYILLRYIKTPEIQKHCCVGD
ncbi:unnamed protein product [Dracunculus medinensis]|uniref:Protein MTO1 homolog, mitochondrial n=1 Tax=Dracunculus medinensis TaxID=318479 RepID=A0A0N4UAS9_DRAME|nr:unnamed protein product [Dracunculus medinensis]